MIVTAQEARRIASGRKTEHRIRRTRRPPDIGAVIPISYRTPNTFLGYEPDGTPRTETKLACRVRVDYVRPGELHEVTKDDARLEGYRSVALLMAAWGDPEDETRVWIIGFTVLAEDRPRLMTPTSRIIAGRQGDYVDTPARAMRDEPEAVDEATVNRFVHEARDKEWERERLRRAERGELSFDEQVAAFTAEARRRHIDIRDELRAIRRWGDPIVCRKQLDSIRRKLEHPIPKGA